MISVEDAIKIVLEQKFEIKHKITKVEKALNYVLSEDVYSKINLPPFDNSAMDGYAVCGIFSSYKIVGENPAGKSKKIKLKKGEALRIFTGSPVPENTTAVIMQEKTSVKDEVLTITDIVTEGKNIRKKGEEISKNGLLLEKNHLLNSASLGVLYSAGVSHVKVFNQPKIGIVITGNELVNHKSSLKHGQIYDSNSVTLSAAIQSSGYKVNYKKSVLDKFEKIKKTLKEALKKNDLLLISGGISVGDYDFVKKALEENGVSELFYKINQKPGKPLFFGKKKNKFVFALPGNPASALTCFYIYAYPLINMLSGKNKIQLERKFIEISHSYEKKGERAEFLKAIYGNGKVKITEGQSSSMLLSYAKASALCYIPAETKKVEKKEKVEVIITN